MIITVAAYKGGVGKTTTAVHLAGILHQRGETLLVDGDLNRSALQWAANGRLPFKVVDEREAVKASRDFQNIVIDTPARPAMEDLRSLAKGCDLLVVPATPDALSLGALLEMVVQLDKLGANYKILLTIVPPAPNMTGKDAALGLMDKGFPVFDGMIRRWEAFRKAALQGLLVRDVRDDRNAGIAWANYQSIGRQVG